MPTYWCGSHLQGCPRGASPLHTLLYGTERTLPPAGSSGSVEWLLRLGQPRHCGFCLPHSWTPLSEWSQLPCPEDPQAANERPKWGGSEACHQQLESCEWAILEVDPLAQVEPLDDYSLQRYSEPEWPSGATPRFVIFGNYLVRHIYCCCKLLSLGVVYYAAINDWYCHFKEHV